MRSRITPIRLALLSLVLSLLCAAPGALAGDYDRDVNRAIDALVRDPARGYDAYKTALEHYRDERGKAFECLLGRLGNASPDADINSDWDSCLGGLNSAMTTLKSDLLLAFKDANPDGDFDLDRIGLKEFMPKEEAFVTAIQGKRFFPEARSLILTGVKIANQSLAEFDQRWDQIARGADDLEAKKAEEENTDKATAESLLDKLKEEAKAVRDGLADDKTHQVENWIGLLAELSKHTDAFWALCATEKGAVFTIFRTARETAQKVYDERIRPEVSAILFEAAKKVSEENSALTDREDYKTFAGKALEILSGYVRQERELSDQFLERNRGRFLEALNDDTIRRLGGGEKMKQLVEDMELEEKTLEELLTKFEADVSGSSATDEVKSSWRDFKDSLLSAGIYDRWVQGYEEYKKNLEENGIKR